MQGPAIPLHSARTGLIIGLALLSGAFGSGCVSPFGDADLPDCPEGVELEVSELTLSQGQSKSIRVIGNPTDCRLHGYVDDPLIVSSNPTHPSYVTALEVGQTTLHVVRGYEPNRWEDTCLITVIANPVAAMTLSADSLTVRVGYYRSLFARLTDADGRSLEAAAAVAWVSSDTTIAAVTSFDFTRGRVRGVRPGMAVVTGTYVVPGTEGLSFSDSSFVEIFAAGVR